MKRILITTFTLVCFIYTYAQQKLIFNYDNSGNRISRVIHMSRSLFPQDEQKIDENLLIEKDEIKITISPNPTHGLLNIQFNKLPNSYNTVLCLYNTQGIQIKKLFITELSTTLSIDNELDGIYFLNISIGEKLLTWKIIKE